MSRLSGTHIDTVQNLGILSLLRFEPGNAVLSCDLRQINSQSMYQSDVHECRYSAACTRVHCSLHNATSHHTSAWRGVAITALMTSSIADDIPDVITHRGRARTAQHLARWLYHYPPSLSLSFSCNVKINYKYYFWRSGCFTWLLYLFSLKPPFRCDSTLLIITMSISPHLGLSRVCICEHSLACTGFEIIYYNHQYWCRFIDHEQTIIKSTNLTARNANTLMPGLMHV